VVAGEILAVAGHVPAVAREVLQAHVVVRQLEGLADAEASRKTPVELAGKCDRGPVRNGRAHADDDVDMIGDRPGLVVAVTGVQDDESSLLPGQLEQLLDRGGICGPSFAVVVLEYQLAGARA